MIINFEDVLFGIKAANGEKNPAKPGTRDHPESIIDAVKKPVSAKKKIDDKNRKSKKIKRD